VFLVYYNRLLKRRLPEVRVLQQLRQEIINRNNKQLLLTQLAAEEEELK
jgi:hypothetical protein